MPDGAFRRPSREQICPNGETLRKFWDSDRPDNFIIGPIGSGKTFTLMGKLVNACLDIPPMSDGVKRARVVIARATTPDLESPRQTFEGYMEQLTGRDYEIGHWRRSPPTPRFKWSRFRKIVEHDGRREVVAEDDFYWDGCRCEFDFSFIPLDAPDSRNKLFSMDLSFVWLSEFRQMDRGAYEDAAGRVGRFPSFQDMGGLEDPSRMYTKYVLGDSNSCEENEWPYKFWEEYQAGKFGKSVLYVRQPGVLRQSGRKWLMKEADEIENSTYLEPTYYSDLLKKFSDDRKRVFLANEWGLVGYGRRVLPNYSDEVHGSAELEWSTGTLILTLDPGLSLGFLVSQWDADGKIFRVMRELVIDDNATINSAIPRFHTLLEKCRLESGAQGHIMWVDQSANRRSEVDGRTVMRALRESGFDARAVVDNTLYTRIESADSLLQQMIGGQPAVQIDRGCVRLREALSQGYVYSSAQHVKSRGKRETVYNSEPKKDNHSHIADAFQYACMTVKHSTMRMHTPVEYSGFEVGDNRFEGRRLRGAESVRVKNLGRPLA